MTVKVIFCVSTNQHTHIAHECTHAHTHTHTHTQIFCIYITLKDQKRSLSRKNDNALWHYRNSYNMKFRVMAVFKQLQHVGM